MNGITRFSLKNPFAVMILAALMVMLGVNSFTSLKVDLLPNIEFPQMTIQSVYPGASPTDVNEKVTTPLEKKLKEISGIEKLTSQSFDSISIVSLSFPLGSDMDDIERKVNDVLKTTALPDTVKPEIKRFSFGAFPIMQVAMFAKGKVNLNQLVEDQLKPELERIPGVASVAFGGTRDELMEIIVDNEKAKKASVTLSSIQQKINGLQMSFPAGTVTQDSVTVPVRVDLKLKTMEQLKALRFQVPQSPKPQTFNSAAMSGAGAGAMPSAGGAAGGANGFGGATAGTGAGAGFNMTAMFQAQPTSKPVYMSVGEMTEINQISEKRESTRYDAKEALSLTITKKQDSNTVELAKKVNDVFAKYNDKVDTYKVFDQSQGIEKSVNSLRNEGLFGALFASLAVLLFLRRFVATIIAILSIPLSLLVASIFLANYGITLNIMTLGGMAIAVGRVVDDSIVVIENIFRRFSKMEGEFDRRALTMDATKEMLKAITASTVTTIVVFLPIGLVGGITGEFFLPFALTVVFSLVASLIVALTIVPVLSYFTFRKVVHEEKESAVQRIYGNLIAWSLNHKWVIILASIVILISSFVPIGLGKIGAVFIQNEKQKLITVSMTLPASTKLDRTNEVSKKIESFLIKRNTVEHVLTGVGSRDFRTGLKNTNVAQYFVTLKETADVKAEIDALQGKISGLAEKEDKAAKVSVAEVSSSGPPSNNNVDIDLYSQDVASLEKAAGLIEVEMKKDTRLRYVTNNFQETQKQWQVVIDPVKADEKGVSGFAVLSLVSDKTRPIDMGKLTLDGVERNVQLRYKDDVNKKEELEDLKVFSSSGLIKLTEVAEVSEVDTVTSIQKLDGKIYARVSAQIEGNNVLATSTEVTKNMQNVKLPDGVTMNTGSGSDQTTKTFIDLGIAVLIAIGLVYIVMLITFGKARIPLIILISLLFVPIGSLYGLWIVNEPFSLSVGIGLLMLVGIVVTNAIVYVDRVGQNRDGGMAIRESLIEAGKTRLRPIVMTAFATVCALIPLAMTQSEGNLISKGLAVAVIGGLTTSTLLTLIIVPVFYEIFHFIQVRRELSKG